MGEDCVDVFLEKMAKYAEDAIEYLWDPARMVMQDRDRVHFNACPTCRICNKFIDITKDLKVRDHDHVTGAYLGPAHNRCNLRARQTYKIPIFFHNFRGYDGHFITKALDHFRGEKIKVIGQGMEKYLTLTIGHLVFKDSLMFLGASLQTLGDNLLKAGLENFKNFKKHYPDMPEDKLRLILRKGIYPYEYMDSMARFAEPQLPAKEHFYSRLNDSEISDEDYLHAQKVWETFNIPTMLGYHNLYLMSTSLFLFTYTSFLFSLFSEISISIYLSLVSLNV